MHVSRSMFVFTQKTPHVIAAPGPLDTDRRADFINVEEPKPSL